MVRHELVGDCHRLTPEPPSAPTPPHGVPFRDMVQTRFPGRGGGSSLPILRLWIRGRVGIKVWEAGMHRTNRHPRRTGPGR